MRWGVAAVAIVVLHLAVAYGLQALRSADDGGGPPPAMTINLAPLAFAPPVLEEAPMVEPMAPETIEPIEETDDIAEVPPDPVVVPEPVERATAEEATTVPAETEAETVERVEPR